MGHQRQEASFSGDWGGPLPPRSFSLQGTDETTRLDLYSFVTRMKAEARRRGVDLLLVDSGDRVDGNGLVDAEPEGHVKG
jgi:2',3'-cyclic-nucleotide 2'-phosphodiesterase (5'-nucleotidase family)